MSIGVPGLGERTTKATRDGSRRSINSLPMSIAPTPARNEREITGHSLRLSTVKAGLILGCGWITPNPEVTPKGQNGCYFPSATDRYSIRVLFAYNAKNTRHAMIDGNAISRAVQMNRWLKITANARTAAEKIASDRNNLLLCI